NMNRNKRSIAINLKSDAGKAILFELAKDADILVENYRPGVMKRLGVGYEVMSKINPALVYVSISGFGQSGPWAERPGFDLMAQAMSGVMSVTGHGDGKPVKAGVPVADIGCALFAVYAALSAFIGAKNTGQGQYIDASLFDSALAFSIWDTSEYWGTGQPPVALGTANRMTAPYQAVKAKDGYFVMGATNNKLWQKLCTILARPDLLQNPAYQTIAGRLGHRDDLITDLEKSFVTKNANEWIDLMLAEGIPAGPILDYPQAFESEHGKHRQMKIEIDHPLEGKVPNIGFAVKMQGTPQQVRRHPPLLGEHTQEVLEEAGFTSAQIESLRTQGAFAA
ncbi:MAG: CoA transferase, partial [Burkholderiaceae bacterium]|nr:CoA transferase [Burkholderiaceae bacterium]